MADETPERPPMPSAEWDGSLETGLARVDRQHQALFRQIAVLLDRSQHGRVPATLDFLATYAVEHFGTEERLHEESDYPLTREHLDAHNAFIARFLEIKKEYDESDQDIVVLMKLTKFLLDWLREHIQGADRQFAEYYVRLEAEAPPDGDAP